MPIPISTFLLPSGGNNFFLLEDKFIRGGYQTYDTLLQRDAIPLNNRKIGMLAYVTQTDTIYKWRGPEAVPEWTELSFSLNYAGNWDLGSSYSLNDVVGHEGSSWICTNPVNAGQNAPGSPEAIAENNWSLLASKGDDGLSLTPVGNYVVGETYYENDVVTHNESSWVCVALTQEEPTLVSNDWQLLAAKGADGQSLSINASGPISSRSLYDSEAEGFVFLDTDNAQLYVRNSATPGMWTAPMPFGIGAQGPQGDPGEVGMTFEGTYNVAVTYNERDVVEHEGSAYISTVANNVGNTPGVDAGWSLLASKGDTGDQGPQGIQGIQGIQGEPGEQGVQGIQGEPGPAGADGQDGTDGVSFIWQGTWVVGTTYQINDVVSHNGSVYIATEVTTGNDPSVSVAQWELMVAAAQGFNYQGVYSAGTTYSINDVVTYNGSSYISLSNGNIGNDPTVAPEWELIASAGAQGVQGVQGIQGVPGTDGQDGAQGIPGQDGVSFIWQGIWAVGTNYNLNDVVERNGSIYIATTDSVGEDPAVATGFWDLMVSSAQGFNYLGAYSAGTTYATDDVVTYAGSTYISVVNSNTGNDPATTPEWELLAAAGAQGPQGIQGIQGIQGVPGADGQDGAPGADGTSFNWTGDWNNVSSYLLNDVVQYQGSAYIAVAPNTNKVPGTDPEWELMVAAGTLANHAASHAEGGTDEITPAAINALSAVTPSNYDIGLFAPDAATASQVVSAFVAPRSIKLKAALPGSLARCLTAPDASVVFDIKVNGTTVGTLTFAASATSGTFSFVSEVVIAAGDVLTLVAPSSANTVIKNVVATLVCWAVVAQEV